MMTGYGDRCRRSEPPQARRYEVVAHGGGWSVSINGACTRPFADRDAAEGIARQLQRQADALSHAREAPASTDRRAFERGA